MFWIVKPVIICSVMDCPVVSDPNFHWRIIVTVTKDNTIWISHEVLFAGSVIKINLCLHTKIFWPGNEHNEYKMWECYFWTVKYLWLLKFLASCVFFSLVLDTEFLGFFLESSVWAKKSRGFLCTFYERTCLCCRNKLRYL